MNNLCRFLTQSCMRIFLTLAVMLGLGALSVRAEYFYVATNGAHGDFKSWTAAATNIQDAVNVATNTGDIVLVSNGVYTTSTPIFMSSASNIVALTNQIILKSVNGPTNTVIDGHFTASNPGRVVYLGSNATLDGFTVRNGNLQGNTSGGGIQIYTPGGTVTNCIVYNNFCYYYGGGISINSAVGIVANCTIYSNSCVYNGGGIYGSYASSGTMVNNCVIWGNSAAYGAHVESYGGGGLSFYGSYCTVKNCLIYGNSSLDMGGGVYNGYAYPLIFENCTITSNTATDDGGGLYMNIYTNTQVAAYNTIFYNNSAGVNADANTRTVNALVNSCIGDTNGVPNWNASGNITNNPQFIDAANNNYRLLSASPCINTGTNRSWMTDGVDLDGKMRIRYRWVDMGAYEHINKGTIYSF